MERYRRVSPRIWHDEQFVEMDAMGKLAWLALLTHPTMTPMGTGVFPGLLLDRAIGAPAGLSERMLKGFKDRGMVYLDRDLVAVKNFLLYNVPENPNALAGWVGSCEELPRSKIFVTLRDHLRATEAKLPEWLFVALLDPLAEQRNRDLRKLYWDRLEGIVAKPKAPGSPRPNPPTPLGRTVSDGSPDPGTGAGAGTGAGTGETKAGTHSGAPPRVSGQEIKPKARLTDDVFVAKLKANPAYRGIDINAELCKMDAWLLTKPGRLKTQGFVVNWLNKIDRGMAPTPSAKSKERGLFIK